MITIRKANERGHGQHGWLDTRHTFSFADYYDPDHMGFGPLRVINEDRVAPGRGFGTHSHRDMEIITYVLEGALEHRDSLGTGSVIRPGDVQRMSAGTGIQHSEFNASDSEAVHFLQIWILPEHLGRKPSYEQKTFPLEETRDRLRLIASRDGRQGSVTVDRDVDLYAATLSKDRSIEHPLAEGRQVWLQIARGAVRLDGESLEAGDGVALTESSSIALRALEDCELLLFDMA